MSVTRTPLTEHVGLELVGMTGPELLRPEVSANCLTALERYGVVVYREINVTDDELVVFSRLLGDVVPNPTGEHELPEIATITLDPTKTDALLAWFRQGNFLWHIDGATDVLPQRATLLSAQVVAQSGGETEFASTYAAYAALGEADKAEIEELRVVHSFAAAQRQAHPDATEQEQARWERVPARIHPLVWKRANGRRSLLLGATADEIVGWPPEKGKALLERLLTWSTQPEFVLQHHWRTGDLVIWDNTGMLHRALPFEPTSPRLMHRTTLVGTEQVA